MMAGLRVVGLPIMQMTIVDTSTVLNLEEEGEHETILPIIAPYMYDGARPCST